MTYQFSRSPVYRDNSQGLLNHINAPDLLAHQSVGVGADQLLCRVMEVAANPIEQLWRGKDASYCLLVCI